MPCITDHYEEEEGRRKAAVELRMLRAVACGLVTALESSKTGEWINDVDWEEAGVARSTFLYWLNQHRTADAARRAAEQDKQYSQRVRARAVAKLTAEEQRVLGLAD